MPALSAPGIKLSTQHGLAQSRLLDVDRNTERAAAYCLWSMLPVQRKGKSIANLRFKTTKIHAETAPQRVAELVNFRANWEC